MQHLFDKAYENSGIGMLINFVSPTQQTDFYQKENFSQQGIIIYTCDKVDEISGSWFILSPEVQGVKWIAELGYRQACTYIAAQKSSQIALARVAGKETSIIVAETCSTTTAGQVIRDEIGYASLEGIKIGEVSD